MGVEPKIGGKPPKWMVKIMENPFKMDDLGVPWGTPIFGNTHILIGGFLEEGLSRVCSFLDVFFGGELGGEMSSKPYFSKPLKVGPKYKCSKSKNPEGFLL